MTTWNYQPNDDGAIEIPVKVKNDAPPTNQSYSAPAADEDVVRDYEARYFGMHQEMPYNAAPKTKREEQYASGMWHKVRSFDVPPRHRYGNRPGPVAKDGTDRTWATLAHASALFTLIAFLSGGPAVIFGLLIPLGIYLFFRNRSEYVAFHALQAFTFQTVSIIGSVLAVMGLAVATFASFLASFLIVGIPFLLLFGSLFLIAIFVALFNIFVGLPVYAFIAANATWSGRNYRYPWVADWVDDQLMNGMFSPNPTTV